MQIKIYYDYNCPYCYLLSNRIDVLKDEFDLDIDWKGLEIHPEYPPEGKTVKKSNRSRAIARTIEQEAEQDSVIIKLRGKLYNSRLCLFVSEYAKSKGLFDRFHKNTYKAYFQDGLNIGELETVLEIADISDLDVGEVKYHIDQGTYYETLKQNRNEAKADVVLGVPTMFFGAMPVHGAQSLGSIRSIIKKALLP